MAAIAITGMHRSGTSMVAHSLRAGGLHLGDEDALVKPAPDNPAGFFEHRAFVALNDELLAATGGAWDNPPTCPPLAADDPRVSHLSQRATDLIASLSAFGPWGWKDPRLCLTARFWLDLLPDLRLVVCVRNPLEVALSLKRRNQNSYSLALRLWHEYYTSLLDAVPRDQRLVTHYDAWFKDPNGAAERLLEFASLNPAAEAAAEAFDRHLRHHDLEVSPAAAGVSEAVIELYDRLSAEAGVAREAASTRSDPDAGRVQRALLDLETARQLLDRRERKLVALERQRDELRANLAAAELALEGSADHRELAERLDRVEDHFFSARYERAAPAAAHVPAARELVRIHATRSDRILVVCNGDPDLLDLYGRPASPFPQDASGKYPGHWPSNGFAAIAHLEALRAEGHRMLLFTAPYRWWLDKYREMAAHLARFTTLVDEPAGSLLVDLDRRRAREAGWPADLAGTLDRLSAAAGGEHAVLDWSAGRDLRSHLPDRNVFRPPAEADELPYADQSIDVVVIEDRHRAEEASRVASFAVVVIDDHEALPVVSDVALTHDTPVSDAVIDVELAPETPAEVVEALQDTLDLDGIGRVRGEADGATAADAPYLALLEPGVVPLPGALAAAYRTLENDRRCGAVAVKLFSRDGELASAGVTVFADGMWHGTAAGGRDPRSAWHERVRPVDAGIGMLVARREALEQIEHAGACSSAGELVELAGALWSRAWRVLYQPDAAAVRTLNAADVGASGEVGDAWHPALTHRPVRPAALDDDSWLAILLTDDPQGSWRR